MSEAEQKISGDKRPLERSPSFPYIGLTKAIERAEQLHTFARRHDVRIVDAAKPAWDMGPKSSSTQQTVGALLAFGLVEASGVGEGRKIKITDATYRAIADTRPGAKEQALQELALKPKIMAEFWERWGTDRPADAIALADLTIDRGFTADGAKAFLRVYDDTVRYVSQLASDKTCEMSPTRRTGLRTEEIAVGDLVRLEVDGQIVVDKAAVRAVAEHADQMWVFVEGSETGILMSDATLLEKGPPTLPSPPSSPKLPLHRAPLDIARGPEGGMDRFTVDEGVVTIAFPAEMSVDSVGELDEFFKLFIKKAKRRAGNS